MLTRAGASDAGRLRMRLALERATRSGDGAGGASLTWNTIASVWGDVTPVRAAESARGEGVGDLTLQRIVIRHRADIRGDDRFRKGTRIFRIRSIADLTEDRRFLVCDCDEEGTA